MREVFLHAGASVAAVIDNLQRLSIEALNIARAGGGDPIQLANRYLQWTEVAEGALRGSFTSSWVWEELHTGRYAEIRGINRQTARPHPLISLEAEAESERLAAIAERLAAEQKPFELPTGYVAVVPDSNIFMHYQPFDQIDWPREMKSKGVRLVVPLIVIDQLDEKSYASNPRGDRVRRIIGSLRKARGEKAPEEPVQVRGGVEYQGADGPSGA